MEIINEVKEIFDRHPFSNIYTDGYKNVYDLINAHNELLDQFKHPTLNDNTFIEKYKSNIPKGWYGFSIGLPVNPVWIDIIDEILQLCIEKDPNIEIKQVKMKFGGIDFHVSSEVITDMWEVFKLVSTKLRDKALIY